MAKLTIHDAEQIAGRNRPWSFRLEYVGPNGANLSGSSSKFWYATGRGLSEPVETGWGAIGSAPQTKLVGWQELRAKVADKLSKGYDYVNHPFVKMSAENLTKIKAGNNQSTNVPSAPATASLQNLFGGTPSPVSVPSNTTVPKSLLILGEPWSLIVKLVVVRTGTLLTGYKAVDEKGDEVLTFDTQGGIDFAREHGLDVDL
jgi:hypothetical protein